MIQRNWQADNKKFCLYVTIKSHTPNKREFRVVASDTKLNSKYADRVIEVEGTRDIYLSFPISPKMLGITVMDVKAPTGTDFEVTLQETNLRSSSTFAMDDDTRSFVQMAIIFSQVCGFTNVSPTEPKLYQSSDGLYNIKIFDVIRDSKSGEALGTPARIGHGSGIIEVAKKKFDKYTIPQRVVVLLHEFSHKYKNPKMGLEIQNESGADLNALYIFLGLGFSAIDAIFVFKEVFYKAQTEGNLKRMGIIMKYIRDYREKNNLN